MADLKFWNVPIYGYDDIVAVALKPSKARWAVFLQGKEAGYYDGRDGFSRFLTDVGRIVEITADQARQRIGGHKPVGAPRDWEWGGVS
jgi:hypothetical protein